MLVSGSVILPFLVGNPNLNLHLPLESWEGAFTQVSGSPATTLPKVGYRLGELLNVWCFVSTRHLVRVLFHLDAWKTTAMTVKHMCYTV